MPRNLVAVAIVGYFHVGPQPNFLKQIDKILAIERRDGKELWSQMSRASSTGRRFDRASLECSAAATEALTKRAGDLQQAQHLGRFDLDLSIEPEVVFTPPFALLGDWLPIPLDAKSSGLDRSLTK